MSLVEVKTNELKKDFTIRAVKKHGIEIIKAKIQKNGYVDSFPIVIDHNNQVIDGHHRLEACLELGIEYVPALVKKVSGNEAKKLAFQANEASETSVPMTFVDYAEFIWSQEGTQQDVAEVLGWSRDKVKNYARLRDICKSAWVVIGTSFDNSKMGLDESEVPHNGTTVPFNETLLRSIVGLTDSQQIELVTDLAENRINKARFKKLAEEYAQRNADKKILTDKVGHIVSEELLYEGYAEIDSGKYAIGKLIQYLLDKHNAANSVQLWHGDFNEKIKDVQDKSIDLIITDPPYNIAHEMDIELEGRATKSADFGAWDKHDHADFKSYLNEWIIQFARVLKDNGSGYIFTSDLYISHISEALTANGLRHKSTLVWHKTNPGTSVRKNNFIQSNEYIVYFDTGIAPTFNFTDDNSMQNFIQSAICGGNERLKDGKGSTLHPTQKPESVIRHLLEISSNKGDLILDGFMGVGTVPAVAKKTGRKCIGIEMDATYFSAAQKRIKDIG